MAKGSIGNMATVELATIFLSPYNFPFHLPNLSIYMLISCYYIKSGWQIVCLQPSLFPFSSPVNIPGVHQFYVNVGCLGFVKNVALHDSFYCS